MIKPLALKNYFEMPLVDSLLVFLLSNKNSFKAILKK
jgi:hypothetical protein